jgi:membrane protease subunit HflK
LDLDFDRKIPVYVIAGLIALWLLSGIYIVNPDEQGVIRRFGKAVGVVGSGPHWHLPFPIEKVDTPKVTEIKRMEIGFRTIHPGPPAQYRKMPRESLMLTGDENIIDAQIIVQYKIKDAMAYLFNVREQEELVRDAAEAALRQVVGRHRIDEALTEQKGEIQDETRGKLQELLDAYGLGVTVNLVKFQAVSVPKQVDAAFKDVASAREDKERLVKQAEAYQNDVIPKARGNAEKLVKEAEAYKIERVKRARGDAERFVEVLREYRKARKVTEARLYIETMEKILPGLRKYIVQTDGKGGLYNILSAMPFPSRIPEQEAVTGKGGVR